MYVLCTDNRAGRKGFTYLNENGILGQKLLFIISLDIHTYQSEKKSVSEEVREEKQRVK